MRTFPLDSAYEEYDCISYIYGEWVYSHDAKVYEAGCAVKKKSDFFMIIPTFGVGSGEVIWFLVCRAYGGF